MAEFYEISIEKVGRQQITATIGDFSIKITLTARHGKIFADVFTQDGELICAGRPCMTNAPIIGLPYSIDFDIMFFCEDDETLLTSDNFASKDFKLIAIDNKNA